MNILEENIKLVGEIIERYRDMDLDEAWVFLTKKGYEDDIGSGDCWGYVDWMQVVQLKKERLIKLIEGKSYPQVHPRAIPLLGPGVNVPVRIDYGKIDLKKAKEWLSKNKPTLQSQSTTELKISFTEGLYNPQTSILSIFGKEIKLPRDRNEDHLCRILFKNERNFVKRWSWDELMEKSNDQIVSRSKNDKESWRPIYNAARSLNNRIYRELRIEGFFLTNPITTVKINPKYLK